MVLALALYMHWLLPAGPSDWPHRLALAAAIVAVTDDPEEQLILARIPRWEASYREDVALCVVRGAAGEVSAWQILARSRAERAGLCQSLEGDAAVALSRVRESRGACRHLTWSDQLALYARGRCDSEEGKRLSRHRMPSEKQLAGYKKAIGEQ